MNKLIIALLICSCYCVSSCALMMTGGTKKTIAIIDAPDDLEIKNLKTGEKIEIEYLSTIVTKYKNSNVATLYKTPAIRVKVKKGVELELKSKDIIRNVKFKTKHNVGLLIFETIYSFGVFTAVDLITGANKVPNPPFIDVPAVLSDKPQKTKKEMINYILSN